jgi:sugar lactone lactonase YvrE
MKQLLMRHTITAFAAAVLFVGCGGSSQIGASGAMPSMRTIAPSLGVAGVGPNLYVGNERNRTVTVYAPGTNTPLRTISLEHGFLALIVHADYLYVSTGKPIANPPCACDVTIYAGGKTKEHTITQDIWDPRALAVCPSGGLFVGNNGDGRYNSVSVYSAKTGKERRRITSGVNGPEALACDAQDNLYVANALNFVTVYAPGSSKPLRKITDGIASPRAIALDGSRNVYVSNYNNSTVTVYAKDSTKLLRTIRDGVSYPDALAFDGLGNLYVADRGSGSVTVYAKDSGKVLRTVRDQVLNPRALAFDGADQLYVASDSRDSSRVTVYEKGSIKLKHTISDGVDGPKSLAFGP